MKGRESGMPEEEVWERFFHPERALRMLGLDDAVTDAVEFGCGYGTFTVPAARMIRGILYALDIDPDMTHATIRKAAANGATNIRVSLRDFMTDGAGLKLASVDYVMAFNILHIEHPEILLQEAWRILRPGGKLSVMHWNCDSATPRGPSVD